MNDEDIGLRNPRNFWPGAHVTHTTTMTTLAFEYLAENDRRITFIHAYPGMVNTDIFSALAAPDSFGLLGRGVVMFIAFILSIVKNLFGTSPADSGVRQAFHLTTDKYSPGNLWRIDQHSEPVLTSGVLEVYRDRGWREKVWDHTLSVFERALSTGSRVST